MCFAMAADFCHVHLAQVSGNDEHSDNAEQHEHVHTSFKLQHEPRLTRFATVMDTVWLGFVEFSVFESDLDNHSVDVLPREDTACHLCGKRVEHCECGWQHSFHIWHDVKNH